MTKIIFWLLLILIAYVYLGYPLLLWIIARFARQKNPQRETGYPFLSVIIAAYNEQEIIGEKIANVLNGLYPQEKRQIIVASDASDDTTDKIVKEYVEKGVILYRQDKRLGKSRMLNRVVEDIANGEILVFTDATTMFSADALQQLARRFCSGEVGAVAARLVFENRRTTAITTNHGLYWRYETFLRKKEGRLGVLPFVSGAFYAIRKGLYAEVKDGLPDDSVSPLNVLKKGKKIVFAEEVVGYEQTASQSGGEFRIKVRGVVRELASIWDSKKLLNPFRYPLVSFVLLSHRLLRWCVPFFLLGIYSTTLALREVNFFSIIFWTQNIFYLLALGGIFGWPAGVIPKLGGLPFYFCLVNISAAIGIIKFICGARQSVWTPER